MEAKTQVVAVNFKGMTGFPSDSVEKSPPKSRPVEKKGAHARTHARMHPVLTFGRRLLNYVIPCIVYGMS